MASFPVDANGQRIKTDILVAGFIKDAMSEHKLEIPDEIIGLCFLFCFIKVCDQWDRSLCHETIEIDGECATISDQFNYDLGCCTLFIRNPNN